MATCANFPSLFQKWARYRNNHFHTSSQLCCSQQFTSIQVKRESTAVAATGDKIVKTIPPKDLGKDSHSDNVEKALKLPPPAEESKDEHSNSDHGTTVHFLFPHVCKVKLCLCIHTD